ncbi:MAG: bifunctional 3-deoxy-7-phosphoheptulonate synthase/chorismate mutase type II [Alistipes sp.]|nr:bifunctional 3-deoxy-7-phosphoheptulonate synthase/chorismate mutase type II [Alistipes sp.]
MEPKRPLIIAGPCSAESEEQVLATAHALASTGKVDILRAGVWKPRTKPNTFEGMGVKALPWLKKAKEQTGLPLAIEVANTSHVESAMKHDIDIFWIGARTTSNPFSMQEVAEALRGTEKMVYVKNPTSSDIELWCGGVERLLACGVKNLGLIHRGFAGYGSGDLRNAPMWHIALEMRRRMPDLPIICDPSHICGNREYIKDISQQAADLDYDGFMIESHINPDMALSDAKQQLTPEAVAKLVESIKWRAGESASQAYQMTLMSLREQIDSLDGEILQLLAERMSVAEDIGRIKRDNDVRILQSLRWESIAERTLARSASLGLSIEFLQTLLDAIHVESINHQNKVMKE